MIIALDAMGGDNAPVSTVHGAVLAARESKHKILLVGQEKVLSEELLKYHKRYDLTSLNIEIVNATEVIGMGEHPAKAVRQKKDSSLSVCAKLVADGKADAFVSMGNSGAAMAAALFYLKRIEGVLRPAISTTFPTIDGSCLIADMGANVDCEPAHLLQFALMASIYSEKVLGITNPRVGLVSIGEEPSKGNKLTLAAYELIKNTNLNFVGNLEGRDIPASKADVVIADGFVGNVILKFGEGLAEMILKLVKKGLKKHPVAWASLPFLWLAIKDLRTKVDYNSTGGAPLLGVNGVCVIGHGRSESKAVKNAIFAAANAAEHDLTHEIKAAVEKYSVNAQSEKTNE
ncbi:phosphate acyltransferase PlsX [Endomicrobium proavitum]|uniref:Phosphate acyltransferase n=1 Tax=Endomicrobium proavitum TaxID=1408281 RepID=A0A0G3WJQ5_9BACT|nr:phosphate acyltransferase PlsX [Endomicrobium proavitum]AKL97729.1 phosphate:acyl-ACP acyltransferase [Endomicrobium proavitum]